MRLASEILLETLPCLAKTFDSEQHLDCRLNCRRYSDDVHQRNHPDLDHGKVAGWVVTLAV